MPKVSPIQSNFNGGEISPLLYGRVDVPRYKESLAVCQNYIPLIQGPITRRPGTGYVFATKSPGNLTRLIPFEYSKTQAYMLEFGDRYIRFYKNNGIITNASVVVSGVTNANPAVVTATAHGFTNGTLIVFGGVKGTTELNNVEFKVAGVTSNTFQLQDKFSNPIDSTGFGVYVSGGTAAQIYEVNTYISAPTSFVSAVTQANPASVTASNHGLASGQLIEIDGVSGMSQLNGNTYTITFVDANTFTLNSTDSTGYGAYVSGGLVSRIGPRLILNQVVPSDVPYSQFDLAQVKFAQSDDVLYMAHPSYSPMKLVRLADNNWKLKEINFIDGPYLDQNTTQTTLSTGANSVAGVACTVTASSIFGINNDTGFQATDVGRFIRFLNTDNTWGYVKILKVTSTTVVTGVVEDYITGATATNSWRLGLWSKTTSYPATVVFHQNRLVWAGGNYTILAIRFDGSNVDDYENMSPSGNGNPQVNASGAYTAVGASGTITASNAYAYSLSSGDVNTIRWTASDEQGLLLGTAGGEWRATGSDGVSSISPTSISAKKATSYGSENIQAVQSGKCSIFVQTGGRKVRELNFYFDVNGFRAADLTQMAEHITKTKIIYLAAQKIPQPIVWAVRTDGVLLAMTYERELDALKVGWSRHIIGGVSAGGNAIVESVAVIPSADGSSQDVWVIVQRQINGQTVRYVEYLTQLFDNDTALASAFFVDSGLTYSGVATTTVSGINHLNGQTVSVLADGAPQAPVSVLGGKITLSVAASTITIGLPYNSDGQKLRTDAGSADGTAMGKTRRTHRTGIMFLNTLGFQLGMSFSALDQINLDPNDTLTLGVANPLFSGIISELLNADYDFDNMICWRQNQPLPGTIQGFYPQQVTQDRG